MLHLFSNSSLPLPSKFTYPFHYTPHPLCVMAVKEVQEYISKQIQWHEELQHGKMFGVLIVQTAEGEVGYVAAFSGNLAGNNNHSFFVPPIYDLLQPDGFFKEEEQNITSINIQIKELEQKESYIQLQNKLTQFNQEWQERLLSEKESQRTFKIERDKKRLGNLSEEEKEQLIKESQFQKAQIKRLEKQYKEEWTVLNSEVAVFEDRIEALKKERKQRSAALQMKLFDQFQMLNARGETRGLCSIFAPTPQHMPPAGAGECAAPKMLQYAYLHHYQPIAMAEFWWGDSPKTEIRHHGHYYPACKSKCGPILGHMLQGLEVESNPLADDRHRNSPLEIVYEDEWLMVVNKPAGMLSVPGNLDIDSVQDRVRLLYPEATGPLVVHRLDMATSGLLLIAKTQEIHKALQSQFKNRTIRKRYTALLDGIVSDDHGFIHLPLCLNVDDRPRQMVDFEQGKSTETEYKVLKRQNNRTYVHFFPHTGRTHQLRVHAAHADGLNAPIIGDELYGQKSDRLYLHAESLTFVHPITKQAITVEKKAEWK